MITSVGHNAHDTFSALLQGKTGVDRITQFDSSNEKVQIASEVKNFNPDSVMEKKEQKKADRFIQLGLHAVAEAMAHADIKENAIDKNRFGVSGASGIGGFPNIEKNVIGGYEKGSKGVSPFFVPSTITNMLSGYISIYHSLKGPNLSSTTACAAGVHAINEAAKTIMLGGADAMVVVGAESCVTPTVIRGFANMNALSTRNDNPTHASRPFDAERDGFVLGEGAGAMILESLESAQKRGAVIYGEILGFGESADGSHITTPTENHEGASRALKASLKMAGNPVVDYFNAHGTSTYYNDLYETKMLEGVFGEALPPISSIKGSIGHTLGAAGTIEAVVSIMALNENIMPPTINFVCASDDMEIDYIPNLQRRKELQTVMSANYGFGGTNGAVIFGKVK
jgi:3-oxoacyl-[acyl-carrier-protein] synthase II